MASHIDDETPLFGVNSDPQRSVGLLCACTAADFAERLEEFRGGTLRATPHARIRVRVDGQEVLGPCLNDILFAHRSPADMSRFEMAIVPRERVEELKPDEPLPWFPLRGSGIWIATATGSTAAICSAGGKVQPPRSRRLQYMVRELYTPPHEAQAITPHGFLDPKGALVLVSRMHRAMVWADGPHRKIAIRYGQRITIDVHPQPLMLVRTNYR
jgi:NAD+ kinase